MVTKICKYCNKEFNPKIKTTKYCSFICSGKASHGLKYKTTKKGMKHCSKCDRILPIKSFQKETQRPDGLKPACKFCTSIWTRKLMTYDEIWKQLHIQNWNCAICGKSMKNVYINPQLISGNKTKHFNSISIDHTQPGVEKYQLTHQICNISKSNRNMEELIKWCKNVINTNTI